MAKKIEKEEIYKTIEDLTKKGKTNAEIGLYIKNKYKIKNVNQTYGKKIGKIQEELKLKEISYLMIY